MSRTHVSVPTLETGRLILRPFTAADAPAYAAMNADPDVARYLGNGSALSAEDAWRHMAMLIGHWQLRGFGMWAVAELERPELLVGRVGAHQPEGWPEFEIGWALARSYWGRGYATESASAAMRYAFDVLERPRVVSLIHKSNTRSRAVAERLGERLSGEWVSGERRADIYEIDRETWSSVANRAR